MSTLILTSGPCFYKEEKDSKVAIKLNNINLLEELKKEVKEYNNLLFICSNPDDYKVSEEYAKVITKSLSLSGLKFHFADILDSRNWLFTKSLVKNSDLIILMGGDPIEQMEFFNNIELKEKLSVAKGCLVGISSGSVNMANYVYCSKDKKIPESVYYRGLGLTNINIEPHFDIKNKKRINEVLLIDSKERPFVALEDESFIVIKDNNISLYGKGYYFNNGEYKIIEDNEEGMKILGGNQ